MSFLRAPNALACGTILAAALALSPAPVAAQVSDEIVLNIMRECAKIDDATARLACYDNNIRTAGANPRRNTIPGAMTSPTGNTGAPVSGGAAQGFGSEDVPNPNRFETPAGELKEILTRVASVEQVRPGLYRFALQDGAVWEFTETVGSSYRPPRAGSELEIQRGSLGSFLMRFDRQAPVRVRRVQ